MARSASPRSRDRPGTPSRSGFPRVFISYRRDDAAGHAGRLYDAFALRYGADKVFIDIDAIPPGAPFGSEIEAAVASCDVLIAVIGRNWLDVRDAAGRRRLDDRADYVRREIEGALAEELVVVPACVQGAEVPRAEDLPPSLAPLAARQGVSLTDAGWHDDVARLIQRLEGVRARSGTAEPAAPRDAVARPRPWRALVAAAILFAVVALVAGIAVIARDPAGTESPQESAGTASAGDAEQRLLATVPAASRAGCVSGTAPAPTAQASLACDVAETLTSTYQLFPDEQSADAWYRQERIAEGVTAASGRCSRTEFQGEVVYEVDGRRAGRLFCRLDDEGRPVLWAVDSRTNVGLEAGAWRGGRQAIGDVLELWECCIRVVERE